MNESVLQGVKGLRGGFSFRFLEEDEEPTGDAVAAAAAGSAGGKEGGDSNRTSTSGLEEEEEEEEDEDELNYQALGQGTRRLRRLRSASNSSSVCKMRIKSPASAALSFSRKARRTSSDNISTPNSGRSRSPSILSSDCIAEEENNGNNISNNNNSGTSHEIVKDVVDTKEVSMTNIDRVCQLIHELKEQDLRHHKKRIEEQVCSYSFKLLHRRVHG